MLWRVNQAPALTMWFATASCVTAGKKKRQVHREAFVTRKVSGAQPGGEDGLQTRKTAAQEGKEVPKESNGPGKEKKTGDPAPNQHQ